jgi:dCMP deaminase
MEFTLADLQNLTNFSNKKERYDQAHMRAAVNYSQLSFDSDTQVGALIIRDNNILSFGFNGMPAGMSNECKTPNGGTRWEVLHAEANAILKCAFSGTSTEGATIYTTLSPCRECSKLILQSGIKRMVYLDSYKDDEGVLLLHNNGVEIAQIKIK